MIKLKKQWYFHETTPGVFFLTSETAHNEVVADAVSTVRKLVDGVEPSELTDDEFTVVETFSNLGYLETSHDPSSTIWELGGQNFSYVKENLRHTTFHLIDRTRNSLGTEIRDLLVKSGMMEASGADAKLNILLSDSFHDLPEQHGTTLPVVCNRTRISVGPLIFPFGNHIGQQVLQSDHYLPNAPYSLPAIEDLLQRAWIASTIVRMIGTANPRMASHITEYNLARQEFSQWPV